MRSTPDEFRRRLLINVMLRPDHHDRIWKIAQSLPLGELRNGLEMAHQGADQVTLN
jgi:hypothetical protein